MSAHELPAILVERALKAGADAADVLLLDMISLSAQSRLGKVEKIERAESGDLGLRVFIGKKEANVSTSLRDEESLKQLVDRAISMAKVLPDNPYCGLAETQDLASQLPELEICDPFFPEAQELLDAAIKAEEAALANPLITNSEGGEAGAMRYNVTMAASNGFNAHYSRSRFSLSVAVLAGAGLNMERDYDYRSAVHWQDLGLPEAIGKEAALRTVKRLGGVKIPSTQVPVIYEPRVSKSLLGHFSSAINASSIIRGSSFLKDYLGTAIFKPGIRIIDDPQRRRGHFSKPCDGEGLANPALELVKDGILQSWTLDLRTAKQLGLKSNGRAARDPGFPPNPSTTNLYMDKGASSPSDMIKSLKRGFLVCELIGSGINPVTGDYSRGASGYWIENGEITHPVHEVTIAGNLKDMFLNLTPANDLEFRYGTDAPTIMVEGLTIAGAG